MKTTTRPAFAALILTLATGCHAVSTPAPAAAPRVVHAEHEHEDLAAQLVASEMAAAREGTPLPLPSAQPGQLVQPGCSAAPAQKGFYGFYANDAWAQGRVVLTFDDGPHPKFTPRVLDLLAEKKMKATFFVVGRNISRDTYPLIQRMVADGHTLGSHSYSHDVLMTKVATPADTVETIRSQHEVTTILIDIALVAKSADDFDALFRSTFEHEPATWMTATGIKKTWRSAATRHEANLKARGFDGGVRPYAVLYSRPPGGGPYVEQDGGAGIKLYDEALTKLGMMNVMWHGASGDTVPDKRSDFAFLTKNMEKYAKQGGVLLIHDYMRPDALEVSLAKIDVDPHVEVMSMEDAVRTKYACSVGGLGQKLDDRGMDAILRRGFGLPPARPASEPSFALSR